MIDLPGTKIRLALVIPSLCYGGAERQVIEIARNLDRSRFEVHIILLTDYCPVLKDNDQLREQIYIVGRKSPPDVSLVFRLARLLRGLKIQIVHNFLFLAEVSSRLASLLSGVSVVFGSERNTQYEIATYRWILMKLTCPLTDFVIANSTSGALFNAQLYNLPRSRYRIVYNGVDTNKFRQRPGAGCRAALDIGEGKLVIGMFGSFKRQKNHLFLFETLQGVIEEFPNLVLLLVGDTLFADHEDTMEYKKEVIDALDRYGLREKTRILGNCPDVEEIYPACDFTVLPSFREGTPNVVLESMSCGIPAIVTDVSDNKTIISDGDDGFVVPLGDVEVFTDCICKLLRSEELRRELGAKSRSTMERRFSIPMMIKNISQVYFEAASQETIR